MKSLTRLLAVGAIVLTFAGCKDLPNMKNPNYQVARDGDYPWMVVFAYDDEKDKFTQEEIQRKKDELTLGAARFGPQYEGVNLPVEKWWQREAEKNGQEISMPPTFYPKQIKVPKDYIYNSKDRHSIDLVKFRCYLSKNYPEIDTKDFVAVLYNDGEDFDTHKDQTFYKHTGSAAPNYGILLTRTNNFVTKLTRSYVTNATIAHEIGHVVFRASDKYGNFDPNDIYDPNDIMKDGNMSYGGDAQMNVFGRRLKDEIIVGEKTKEEIGW